jgi:hypothetical protein
MAELPSSLEVLNRICARRDLSLGIRRSTCVRCPEPHPLLTLEARDLDTDFRWKQRELRAAARINELCSCEEAARQLLAQLAAVDLGR